jgi:hypothetical protein
MAAWKLLGTVEVPAVARLGDIMFEVIALVVGNAFDIAVLRVWVPKVGWNGTGPAPPIMELTSGSVADKDSAEAGAAAVGAASIDVLWGRSD